MSTIKVKLILSFILCISIISCSSGNNEYYFTNIRVFENTKVWDLAKAVDRNDTVKIKEILKKHPDWVDIPEPRWDNSLLQWAVYNNHFASSKILTESRADVNRKAKDEGSSAFIMGCGKSTTSDYVRLFLKYGGKVNDYAPNTENLDKSPILSASRYRLESVKLLVEAGANVNFEDTLTKPPTTSLTEACLYNEIEIIKYLLENRADYKKLLFVGNHNRQDYIMDFLRRMDFSNDSKKNRTKQEVIGFLEKRGLKY